MEDSFINTFSASGASNIVSFVLFLVAYVIREKCRKSSCKSHTACCDCRIDKENSDVREDSSEIEICVQKMHSSDSEDIPKKHQETI